MGGKAYISNPTDVWLSLVNRMIVGMTKQKPQMCVGGWLALLYFFHSPR